MSRNMLICDAVKECGLITVVEGGKTVATFDEVTDPLLHENVLTIYKEKGTVEGMTVEVLTATDESNWKREVWTG